MHTVELIHNKLTMYPGNDLRCCSWCLIGNCAFLHLHAPFSGSYALYFYDMCTGCSSPSPVRRMIPARQILRLPPEIVHFHKMLHICPAKDLFCCIEQVGSMLKLLPDLRRICICLPECFCIIGMRF